MLLARATTILSLTALARIAERHVRQNGPVEADALVDIVFLACGDLDRAHAGIRLALIGGRLALDRDATLRLA